MKKFKVFMIVVVLIFVFVATNLEAGNKPFNLYINGGVMTDDSLSFDPYLWTAGINLDFHLGDFLMLSPEAYIIVYEFEFDPFVIAPGCLLNVKFSSFFAGAGLTKWIIVGENYSYSNDIAFKINAGFVGDNYRIAAFAVMDFDNMFDSMMVGATIGIGF